MYRVYGERKKSKKKQSPFIASSIFFSFSLFPSVEKKINKKKWSSSNDRARGVQQSNAQIFYGPTVNVMHAYQCAMYTHDDNATQ